MHIRGARTNGLTPEEIGEVLLHTAVYAGVPAANAAFAIAQRPSPTNPQQTHREPNAEARTAAGDARTRRCTTRLVRTGSGSNPVAQIAAEFGVSRPTIYRHLHSRPRRRTRRKRAPWLGHSCLWRAPAVRASQPDSVPLGDSCSSPLLHRAGSHERNVAVGIARVARDRGRD